ncbi:MAG TPA: DUF5698 domain-containing protein [Phototrophicaceae bacterium]|jgi:uncharacterized protein YebE (UPF0316 family)|nr:DUF5698 domain-containing protein [Phototrophicaceae bacterium]
MVFEITLNGLLFAGLIFILRVLNYSISTIRTVAIARQERVTSSVLAFFEALLFAVVIANVVKDLTNFVNLMAYCLGAAAGGYVGMALEARFITSYLVLNIMAHDKGSELAQELRNRGFGVTVINGEGRDGEVTMLRCVVGYQSRCAPRSGSDSYP